MLRECNQIWTLITFSNVYKQVYIPIPNGKDYWYQNSLGLVSAITHLGTSTFVVFDPSRNSSLRSYVGPTARISLSSIPSARPAWRNAKIYIIPNEVKVQGYSDGSIIFFPMSSPVPHRSPIGRAAYATWGPNSDNFWKIFTVSIIIIHAFPFKILKLVFTVNDF